MATLEEKTALEGEDEKVYRTRYGNFRTAGAPPSLARRMARSAVSRVTCEVLSTEVGAGRMSTREAMDMLWPK